MFFHGLWQVLVARASHRDSSAVDLNKYTNTMINAQVTRSAVSPKASYLFTKKLLFWRKSLLLLFVAVAVSTAVFLCAPSGLPVRSCSLLCQMGMFWDSPFVLSSSCPEASGSFPKQAFVPSTSSPFPSRPSCALPCLPDPSGQNP